MAYSRWRFVASAIDEKDTITTVLTAEAWAAVGGVQRKVLADRMGCLDGGVIANIVISTPDYVRFATLYGFAPDFCPRERRTAERIGGEARPLRPTRPRRPVLTEAAVAGTTTVEVGAANAAARIWCAEVNAAVHS
ncbi:MAG: hypothetical protein ACOH2Q_22470 [Rhodococcus sp. (in: high G+C Gram-positive bacteria)]